MPPKLNIKKPSKTMDFEGKTSDSLFDNSPHPGDRYASPSVNKLAKNVFKSHPNEELSFAIEEFTDVNISESDNVLIEHAQDSNNSMNNSIDVSKDQEIIHPSASNSKCNTPHRPTTPTPPRSAEKPAFEVGDLIWAQTDVQFPFWPGIVVDAPFLPEDLQQAYHFTIKNGKNNKLPVYFYGRCDYDVISPTRMRDYCRYRDSLKSQNITGSLYVAFRKGVRQADDNVEKDAAARLDWVANARTGTAGIGGKEGKYNLPRSGSMSSSSSRYSSRAPSMLNTEGGHEAVGSSATALISPLSDNLTPLSGLSIGSSFDSDRIPTRFTFPDSSMHSQTTVQHLEPVPECPSVASDLVVQPSEMTGAPSLTTLASANTECTVEGASDLTTPQLSSLSAPIIPSTGTGSGTDAATPAGISGSHTPAGIGALGSDLGSDFEMVEDTQRDTIEVVHDEVVHDEVEITESARPSITDSLALSHEVSQHSTDLFAQLEDEQEIHTLVVSGSSSIVLEEESNSFKGEKEVEYIAAVDTDNPLHTTVADASSTVDDPAADASSTVDDPVVDVSSTVDDPTPLGHTVLSPPRDEPISTFSSPGRTPEYLNDTPTLSQMGAVEKVCITEIAVTETTTVSLESSETEIPDAPAVPSIPLPLPRPGVKAGTPAKRGGDASSLFGASTTDPFAAPAGGMNDPFSMSAPPAVAVSMPPPRDRVTSGGRAAGTTQSRGLFDSAPVGADSLFGSGPSNSTAAPVPPVVKKTVVTRNMNTASASDLFGSSSSSNDVFGSTTTSSTTNSTVPPPAVRPVTRSSPQRTGISDAASLFGGGGGAADPFAFGSSAPPPPLPATTVRPPVKAPTYNAASMFYVSSSTSKNTAQDMFGAPPAAVAAAASSVPSTADADADSFFGGSSAKSLDFVPAENNNTTTVAATAVFSGDDFPPAVEVPTHSAQLTADTTDSSYELIVDCSITATTTIVNAVDTAGSEEAPFFPDTASTTSHQSSPCTTAAVPAVNVGPVVPTAAEDGSLSPPTPAVHSAARLLDEPPTPTENKILPTTATRSSSEALPQTESITNAATQPDLRRTSSSGPVFKGRAKMVSGASPFDTVSTANTADILFGAPTGPAPVASRMTSDPFGAPSNARGATFPSASNTTDPFSNTSNNDAATAFSTIPAVMSRSSSSNNGADLFAAPPPGGVAPPSSYAGFSNGSGKQKANKNKANLSASDVFSSAAPKEQQMYAPLPDAMSPPVPRGVKASPKPPVSSNTTLSVNTQGLPSPSVPHTGTPYGTHTKEAMSPMVPPSGVAPMALSFPGGALPSPATTGAGSPFPHSDPVQSSTAAPTTMKGKAPLPKKKAPPPGMIATPHGYVPIASLQPGGGTLTTGPSESNGGAITSATSKPLVNHNILTSLVTETVPEVASPPQAVSTDTAEDVFGMTPGASTATTAMHSTHTTTTTKPVPTQRYTKPVGPVVAFGFGGKVVTMIPRKQLNSEPVFHPAYGGPSSTTTATTSSNPYTNTTLGNGLVRIHNLLDLVRRELQVQEITTGSKNFELQELTHMLTQFPVPLSISAAAVPTSTEAEATTVLVRDALKHRMDHPLSQLLAHNPHTNTSTTAGSATDTPSSEKLLWTLLKLCVDRGGVLSTELASDNSSSTQGSTAVDAGSTEVKIAQLLLGQAPTAAATTGSTGSATVTVFSGSASNSLTSYVPDMSRSKQLYDTCKPTTTTATMTSEQYVEIEGLLLVGRKEEALRRAISYGEWSLALLIGSVCGPEKYQEIIRGYSAAHFPAAAPMHTLTLLYANQGSAAVLGTDKPAVRDEVLTLWRHNLAAILSNKGANWQQLAAFLGYRLQNEAKDLYAAHAAYLCAGVYPTFPTSSAHSSAQNVRLSAGAYSSTESLHSHEQRGHEKEVEFQKYAGKYSLLGCDTSLVKHRNLSDCISISSFRCTEILEYTLHKRLAEQVAAVVAGKTPPADGIASFGKSISDMFGWKGNNAANTNNSTGGSGSSVPPKSPHHHQAATTGSGSGGNSTGGVGSTTTHTNNSITTTSTATSQAVSHSLRYRIAKVKAVLCPLKLRFAMVLADFGLAKEATAYAMEAKSTVQEIGIAEDNKKANPISPKAGANAGKSRSTSGGSNTSTTAAAHCPNEYGIKPFNRNFARALDEFIDRLCANDKVTAKNNTTSTTATTTGHRRDGSASTGSSSIWGSMMSSINLKDLVDTMVDTPAVGPPPTGPVRSGSAGAPPMSAAAPAGQSAPPAAASLWPSAPPPMPGTSTGHSAAEPSSMASPAPPAKTAHHPTNTSTAGNYAPMSAMPPRPGNMAAPPPSAYPTGSNTVTHSSPFNATPSTHSNNYKPSEYADNGGFTDVDLDQGNNSGFFEDSGYSVGFPPQPPVPSGPYGTNTGGAPSTTTPYGASNPVPQKQHTNMSMPPPATIAGPSGGASRGAPFNPGPAPATFNPGPGPSPSARSAPSPATSTPTASGGGGGFFGFGGSATAAAANTANATTAGGSTSAASSPKPTGNTQPSTQGSTARSASTADDEGGNGLLGSMRKSLLKYMYPDAHDASSNIGKSLEAVYNKETGRWEFPGEENNPAHSAPPPPPTGPIGMGTGSIAGSSGGNSGANSMGVSPSPSMSAFGNPPPTMGGTASSSPAGGDYDPLAAMMAPPSRRMPTSHSTPALNDSDPLAAMMAPPSMRYSMPPPSSTMPSSSSMPAINVWKPPPVPVSAAASPNPTTAAAAGSSSAGVAQEPSGDRDDMSSIASRPSNGSLHSTGGLPPPPM